MLTSKNQNQVPRVSIAMLYLEYMLSRFLVVFATILYSYKATSVLKVAAVLTPVIGIVTICIQLYLQMLIVKKPVEGVNRSRNYLNLWISALMPCGAVFIILFYFLNGKYLLEDYASFSYFCLSVALLPVLAVKRTLELYVVDAGFTPRYAWQTAKGVSVSILIMAGIFFATEDKVVLVTGILLVVVIYNLDRAFWITRNILLKSTEATSLSKNVATKITKQVLISITEALLSLTFTTALVGNLVVVSAIDGEIIGFVLGVLPIATGWGLVTASYVFSTHRSGTTCRGGVKEPLLVSLAGGLVGSLVVIFWIHLQFSSYGGVGTIILATLAVIASDCIILPSLAYFRAQQKQGLMLALNIIVFCGGWIGFIILRGEASHLWILWATVCTARALASLATLFYVSGR